MSAIQQLMLAQGASAGSGGDPYWSNVVSLLHFDGADASTTFTDQSGKIWTANGNAQIDTAQSKFGGSSAYFDGTGDWIQTPDSPDWSTGTGDFTVEMWIKTPGNGAYDQLCGQRDAGGTASTPWGITRDGTNNRLLLSYSDGTSFTLVAGTASIFDDAWHHIALVRNGSSYKQYVDGVLDAQLTLPSVYYSFYESSDVFSIGRHGAYNGQYFKGYIDEFRFTKGVARYTANFTPPSAPFPDS